MNNQTQLTYKYIKVNGIDHKKHCFTSAEVLEAVIEYLKKIGAKIHVMEDCSSNTMTRGLWVIMFPKRSARALNIRRFSPSNRAWALTCGKGGECTDALFLRQSRSSVRRIDRSVAGHHPFD